MSVQNINTQIDTEVDVPADLTTLQSARLADGYRAMVKVFPSPSHGLWILDKRDTTAPNGVTVVLTDLGPGFGNWHVIAAGPPGPAGLGASWKYSGTHVGSAAATIGFMADVPNALATSSIGYPRTAPSGNGIFYVSVLPGNNTLVGSTVITVYVNGVASALTLTYVGGATGVTFIAGALPIVAGDLIDIRVDNPGNAGDIGQQISMAAALEFTP